MNAQGLGGDFAAVFTRWRVWFLMANQDIELRYRRSILGPFWISLAMASLILGIGLLYSQIFRQPFREYLVFIGTGLLAWNFLAGMVVEGSGAVMEFERHLRAIRIPIPLIVARVVYRSIVIFGHNALAVLLMILAVTGGLPLTAPLALIGVAILAVFGFGAGLVLAPISARFRDIPQAISSFMQLMFFITPLFWRPGQLAGDHPVVRYNPFAHLIDVVRDPLEGHLPSLENWAVALGSAVLAVLLGVLMTAYSRRKLFFWL